MYINVETLMDIFDGLDFVNTLYAGCANCSAAS